MSLPRVAYAGFSKERAGNLRIMNTKNKSFYSDLARFSAQNFCPNFIGEGAMTQFCALFLGIYELLTPQRGGHGKMPPKSRSGLPR